MVEVEEGGLGAFEQHVLARVERVVHQAHGVDDVGRQAGGALVEVHLRDLVGVERELVEDLRQDRVLLLQHHVELGAEDLGVEQVLHPDADARRLVGVRRADAALGGAQLGLAETPLGEPVDLLVVRQDQVGVARHREARAVDALRGERVHLGEQHDGVDDHTVADDGRDVVVEDSTGHQLESERDAIDHQGVAGVVAALVADDQLHLLGDEVGDLPLALIAPLSADDDGRRHGVTPSISREPSRETLLAGRGPPPTRCREDPGPADRHVVDQRSVTWLSSASTVTVSPSLKSPSSRARASRSPISRWMTRLRGRAP